MMVRAPTMPIWCVYRYNTSSLIGATRNMKNAYQHCRIFLADDYHETKRVSFTNWNTHQIFHLWTVVFHFCPFSW
jgi:hypothetical protein